MSGRHLYHRVPDNMKGSVLRPLNAMKAAEPEIYELAAKKYAWRLELMQQQVPPLGCLWNDVIHLTPLDPRITLAAIQAVDPNQPPRNLRFVKIPFSSLQREKACWFHPSTARRPTPLTLLPSEFSPMEHYEELRELPPLQRERWKEDVRERRPVLLWSETPHVLYAGEISIAELETFDVSMG